jgi:hypothetical protein
MEQNRNPDAKVQTSQTDQRINRIMGEHQTAFDMIDQIEAKLLKLGGFSRQLTPENKVVKDPDTTIEKLDFIGDSMIRVNDRLINIKIYLQEAI